MGLDGVEIIVNGSGSYMELRKAHVAVELVRYYLDQLNFLKEIIKKTTLGLL